MDQKELIERFHRNVKSLCLLKNIQIGELEKQVGCSVGYLSKKKAGIGLYLAFKIATVLESDLKELLEEDVWTSARIKELEAELKRLKEGDQKKNEAV